MIGVGGFFVSVLVSEMQGVCMCLHALATGLQNSVGARQLKYMG